MRRVKDGIERPLPAHALIGRSSACSLRLEGTAASNEHATLSWTGEAWELRDLGSKNGTTVFGERLEPGKAVRVRRGDELLFGDARERWSLSDDGAPDAIAVALSSGDTVAAGAGLLALPSTQRPLVTVFRTSDADWALESEEGEIERVRDGQIVRAGDDHFRLLLPLTIEGTPLVDARPNMANVSFCFAVSKNEEHVGLRIKHGEREILSSAREHGYLLLTLARERLSDAEQPVSERGWIDRDRLLKMLQLDSNALNVAIHRARQELMAAGLEGAQSVVEVRRRERRFGSDRIRVEAW